SPHRHEPRRPEVARCRIIVGLPCPFPFALSDLSMSQLIAPHGGHLVNLIPHQAAERVALKREAAQLPAWDLSPRQLCDLELILCGGFSPLDGFMGRADYERVCSEM